MITHAGKKDLVDAHTSKTKRSFADIQQKVLHDPVAGGMGHPLQACFSNPSVRRSSCRRFELWDPKPEPHSPRAGVTPAGANTKSLPFIDFEQCRLGLAKKDLKPSLNAEENMYTDT
ncbi:MAG: hypothetical protein FRX49_01504 [Trebouxia sp. A1-2]|nr:MAG: hypothetical protein FRX49_01504 [Trebouxia sp. A1-2]